MVRGQNEREGVVGGQSCGQWGWLIMPIQGGQNSAKRGGANAPTPPPLNNPAWLCSCKMEQDGENSRQE